MPYDPLPPFWAGASQAERDAAYNNSEHVPDSPQLNEVRTLASQAFRSARPGHLDLGYGPPGDTSDRRGWDLFPVPDAAAPCLVFIHGGYWQRNRRQDFGAFMEGAAALGWHTALPGYTLAPDASLTEIVAEIRAALDWFAEHREEHGIAGQVVLSGWSAGGHLTAMALDHPVVEAGLAIAGIYELAPIRDTYLNDRLRLTEVEVAALSPMRLPPSPKPLAIAYGTGELPELVRQSRDFHALRAAAHCPGPLLPVPRADHFRVMEALQRPDGLLLRAAADLLR